MASLSEIRFLLFRIRDKLTSHPAFLRRGGTVEDPGHVRENEELEELSLQLSLILRNLKSRSNLLSLREQNLWSIKPNERYRAAASIASQQNETFAILKLANEIRELLEDMIGRNSSIDRAQLLHGFAEFVEKLYHQAYTNGETQNMPDGLSYISASKADFGGSVESVMVAVFVGLRALLHLRKRLAKDLTK